MMPVKLPIADYHYELPPDRIAQYPLAERDSSKLLVFSGGICRTEQFRNIGLVLEPGSHLVFNDTRVIRARLLFRKETGSVVEIFCLEPVQPTADIERAFLNTSGVVWNCLVGNSKRWKTGTLSQQIAAGSQTCTLTVRNVATTGTGHQIEFTWDPPHLSFSEILEAGGRIPLPPYIHRDTEPDDAIRYQTIFAKHEGSVAAPTAGLHFTPAVMDTLAELGISHSSVTLHVGIGTFKPVTAETANEHDMHPEHFSVHRDTIERLLTGERRKTIAVGTTTARTLESLYWFGYRIAREGKLDACHLEQWFPYQAEAEDELSGQESLQAVLRYLDQLGMDRFTGETQLMIVPGYRFRVIGGMITNFHMPQSTLLLLVAALAGPGWKDAYAFALTKGFRFLSYGDSCLFFGQAEK